MERVDGVRCLADGWRLLISFQIKANKNYPMIGRHLTTVDSRPAQFVYTHWRHWYKPNNFWQTQRHPSSSVCSATQPFNRPPRPPDPYNWSSWRQAGILAQSQPRRGFLHSVGPMDHCERGPPQKRRKGAEKLQSGERSVHLPKSSPQKGSSSPKGSPQLLPDVTSNQTPLELKRHWEDFSHVCQAPTTNEGKEKQPFEFSLMSYNILSQDLLHKNAYLYRHCHPPVLEWEHRFQNIIKEMKLHSADIMCLQEVDKDSYDEQIKPALESLGYQCEFKRRTGLKSDGCAVVFKRARFSLVSCHPVEYFRQGIPLLDRDNVGLIVLLSPIDPQSSFSNICVANTHLLFNPRRGDIKLAQLALLLAEISRVAQLPDGSICPVLLCGDFNSVPWSPLYRFIKDRRLDYEGMPLVEVSGQEQHSRRTRILTVPIWPRNLGISQQCQYESQRDSDWKQEEIESFTKPSIEHCLNLTSAYSHYLQESGQSEVTTCISRTAITVDYIFYSAALGDARAQAEGIAPPERGLQLLGRLALVGEDELQRVKSLPNQNNSSDHLPLLTCFRLYPQADS
ncbi:hypothetical protein DNTS_028469 [Danionella cerebrum]|uniref:Endonuclease/exonuclease/phosphatase domain-containing protein n=1 Tax=Danionella cerebrum TaxID=2873325 RepID=A0A553R7E7_9TELE|nr:hypothetical protein DNTS_028469 [Danionella translucida]